MDFDVMDFVRKLPRDHLEVRMPPDEYRERIERTRQMLADRGLDAGLAYGSEVFPGDAGWLTGFDPQIETTLVVVGAEKVFQLGGPSFVRYTAEMSPVAEFRLCRDLSIPEDYHNLEFHDLRDVFEEAAGGKVRRIGVLTEGAILPLGIKDLVAQATEAEVVDADDFLIEARYYKSDAELDMVRISTQLSAWALEAAFRFLRPGMRELEVASIADFVMRYMGADRLGFLTVLMSGHRASMVGARATNKVIEEGDLLLMSPCARWEGLAGTIGRTIVVGGKPSPDQEELLAHAAHAYELAANSLGYGVSEKDVDVARTYLNNQGLYPLYGLVHNTGWTECMEGTNEAVHRSRSAFPKNLALMVDIGIFDQPYKSLPPEMVGLRIEDTFIIKDDGETERLSGMPYRVDYLLPSA